MPSASGDEVLRYAQDDRVGECRARSSAGQFGPAIRPRRGAPSLYRRNPRSFTRHQEACEAMPGGNTRTTLHNSPTRSPWCAARVPAVGCRRPRIHRRAGRIHRRHLRPLPSGDPRRHRPRAEPWLELRRAQRQRGQARQAGGRPHALDRPGALHQLGHRGQRHGAGRRTRLCPAQGPHKATKVMVFHGGYHGACSTS